MARCEVSERCRLNAYVAVRTGGVSVDAMAPFLPVTRSCRRHISMLIDHATERSADVRVGRIQL